MKNSELNNIMLSNQILFDRNKKIMWHPFTQAQTNTDIIPIKKGIGSYVYDYNDKPYLDLISSWWVTLHGHGHPKIAEAIYQQAINLEHVIFAGFTHEPAIILCEELQKNLPKMLKRFFFSDNGSTAVEVAIKMAYQYWKNLGYKNKKHFISFSGGYHGDTLGCMSLGKESGFHNNFTELLFDVLFIPYPSTWNNDKNIEIKEQNSILVLKDYINNNTDSIAAIIIEPLVQGASGMKFSTTQFIKTIVNIARNNNILIIFDEIMTGFYRTGSYFALDAINIVPDILCLSKGITGGFLPLALTIATEEIYNAFLGEKFEKALAHGHSYTANPLACSAAIASLKLLASAECQKSIYNINLAHKNSIELLENVNFIEKIRILGTILAFDIKNNSKVCMLQYMTKLKKQFLLEGLLLRPLGNTIYILPPYSTSYDDLINSYEKIIKILNNNSL
ncbi:adenosylmethionine--8-amino-7-oxononanoate transaminase [Lyticum sinuosum]|uniref:Adenosylmethionine-8-amino-7-oxononanoate aminotransferase n=1 Tax=Lyticum sinuosum TaxID=1332059 RepID=A0AAE4VKK3_9RICK|nr:adenosylmethionine--8-amino-7-oxononanoate transaminase [Lyticum sinuosum]MDZ5761078.1 Adenosylmethionine-8-amino-7-oxononanoate aminotransferase [Lyticum sinuosum]